jgi:NAD(P)-dependent dehydrogenase (short-subunit alcohol dehydrogenase family)
MKRVALITGGSRGIGFGIATQLAINGFDVAINGTRSAADVEDAVKKLKNFGNDVIYCRGNISSVKDRALIIDEVRKHYDALHVLVNNAGIAPKARNDILEATEESFDDVISVNLRGTYFLMQKAANWMIEQKKNDAAFTGCIINISSISATVASVNRGEYCISKAGLTMATQLFAVRLGEFDIPVFEVRPGVIDTDMTAAVRNAAEAEIKKAIPVRRLGKPEDIAEAVGVGLVGAEEAERLGVLHRVE